MSSLSEILVHDMTDKLVILSTLALTWYTAKAAHETAKQVHEDDARIIRMLVRKNRNARHAKRAEKASTAKQHDDGVWRIS